MSVNQEAVQAALATVIDPEIRRPITEIGMVKDVAIDGGKVTVGVYLTISACPMQDTIVNSVKAAVSKVRDVVEVEVELDGELGSIFIVSTPPKSTIPYNCSHLTNSSGPHPGCPKLEFGTWGQTG